MRAAASDFGGRDGRMLAARVEQKNGTYLNNIQRDRQSSPSLHSSPYLVPILAPFTLRHLYAVSDSRSQQPILASFSAFSTSTQVRRAQYSRSRRSSSRPFSEFTASASFEQASKQYSSG